MDTSSWRTHAIGRFLITLPQSAKCVYTSKVWDSPLSWQKKLTPQMVKHEANRLAKQYQAVPHSHLTGKTQFIDQFDLPNGGSVVQSWTHKSDRYTGFFEAFYISHDEKQRVFYLKFYATKKYFYQARKFVLDMAQIIIARDEFDPLPTDPGFAFEGGFYKHTGEWWEEENIVAFSFPDYPGIKGYFACYGAQEQGQFMFERKGNEEIFKKKDSDITVLRKGDCSLNGIPAQDFGFRSIENGRRVYSFKMESPAAGMDLERPLLILRMESEGVYKDFDKEGFTSDEEAVGVWNAIRDSIRLRPSAL